MDLLTERRLRDVLALRRIGEATLLRDRNKVPELMNFHRRSDTPLGPPVCLRLALCSPCRAVALCEGGCSLLSALCPVPSLWQRFARRFGARSGRPAYECNGSTSFSHAS